MTRRRFIVTVGEAPSRVVVEDVRSRRRAVATDLGTVGAAIDRMIEDSRPGETDGYGDRMGGQSLAEARPAPETEG